ncbi:hypothetical protein GJA_5109 [Janthinobacterium agaricidamnosum NBRC 102515 = DSM 9628]|uniref:Uncharacterized protein n=1 Tax=Janthinobacterium agaricidamnosum NBRC 102515 = DSM 9628 TaxID=1349767 RepID=W0VEE5_9BURK|nr:hypothetical protein GJA_5109 [Janthinobacterium agaricidamnosum NBRC 102515 = DSM 9628]
MCKFSLKCPRFWRRIGKSMMRGACLYCARNAQPVLSGLFYSMPVIQKFPT